MGELSAALIHYPVLNKNGEVVATAVTNLDIHDIARSARTFGVGRYYIVNPVDGQRQLAEKIVSHWRQGWGANYNPKRMEAFARLEIVSSLDDAIADMASRLGKRPKLVATSAAATGTITYSRLAAMVRESGDDFLLLFGTGWGMTEEVMARADFVLPALQGAGEYNHLSVRSAAAIIFDRLAGDRTDH